MSSGIFLCGVPAGFTVAPSPAQLRELLQWDDPEADSTVVEVLTPDGETVMFNSRDVVVIVGSQE